MSQTLFLVISILGVLAAVGTILARNLVHAALYLVAFFFVIACQFVLLEAEFLAAIQVLVYIGAVAILMMFGIMLTRNVQGDETTTIPRGLVIPGLVVALGMFLVLAFGINNHVGLKGRSDWAATVRRPPAGGLGRVGPSATPRDRAVDDMGLAVGRELMTRYALPFEVAGLLLTVALVGAVALAHRETFDAKGPDAGEPSVKAATTDGGYGATALNGSEPVGTRV